MYWVIAASMTLDILVMVVVVAGGNDAGGAVPPVLIGEAVALLLFVAFWVVQSIEKRDDADPSIAAGPPTVSRQ